MNQISTAIHVHACMGDVQAGQGP